MEHINPNQKVKMTQNLRINGIKRQFDDRKLPITLSELLEQLGIDKATVVAEIDSRVIERSRFAETKITKGATIELVHFLVGG